MQEEIKIEKANTNSDIMGLFEHFGDMPDPRMARNQRHKLIDIISIAICATIAEADGWTDMAEYGEAKQDFLGSFLELPNGIPSHDRFRDVFARLDPEAWQERFVSWTQALEQRTKGELVSIDGKRLRGSVCKGAAKAAIHMVSAWANTNRLVLGQVKVDDKSNEIKAIPELLAILGLSGTIVSIDAMGTQRTIAQAIVEQDGDYILALKGNQKTLHEAVKRMFEQREAAAFDSQVNEGHGRIEQRVCRVIHEVNDLDWPHLQSIAMRESRRQVGQKVTTETRYYLSSLKQASAKQVAQAVRSHWGIENQLHWVLDVAFKEDACRIRAGNAAQNLATLRHLALNFLRHETSSKRGIKGKRKKAAWNDVYMLTVLRSLSPPVNTLSA